MGVNVTIIVDPDSNSRERLRNAMRAATDVKSFQHAQNIEQARALISNAGGPVQFIFLSHRLEPLEAMGFIKESKQTINGRDAAYVVLLTDNFEFADLSHSILEGSDGFLIEPFSAAAVAEIAKLAERVSRERQTARLKLAMRLLVTELRDQIGIYATALKKGYAAGITRHVLEEMWQSLLELSPEAREVYFEMVLEIFPATPAPARGIELSRYRGASTRTRNLQAEKALERVRKALANAR